MKKLHYSTQFRKDYKKYQNQPKKIEKLLKVLRLLEDEKELPAKFRAHMLSGQFKDCMECHIEGDFLLIWIDEKENIIELLRLGSHSELFR